MPPLNAPPVLPAAGVSQLGAILFSLTAAAAVTAALMWSLVRVGSARGRVINPPFGFVTAALAFTLLYALDRIYFPSRPVAVLAVNLLLLALALAIPAIRGGRRRVKLGLIRKKRSAKRRAAARPPKQAAPVVPKPRPPKGALKLSIEIANLRNMLRLDPRNTFCYEKLSELYEKQGRLDLALEAARSAAAQDPTVNNNWRVEELEEKLGLKPGPGP